MSKTVSAILHKTAHLVTSPLSRRQRAKTLSRLAEILSAEGDATVPTAHGDLHFFAGRGPVIASAVTRFHEDEPETLHYIDNVVQSGDVLWDIGANAGLYSLYAARRGAEVYAFEPSAFNFALLVDHIRINGLSEHIKPLCIAFSDKDGLADLHMSNVSAGHASNALGEARNQSGAFPSAFTQTVIGLTVDSFIKQYGGAPDHIKLDVDGLEPLILAGAGETLKAVKSLLIEIEGVNAENEAKMIALINAAGLREDETFRQRSASGRNRLFLRAS